MVARKRADETAKSLLLCKAVSSRSFNQLIKLQLEEPLEVNSNVHPRYITVLDKIRLIDAAKASKAKAMLAFAFEPSTPSSA